MVAASFAQAVRTGGLARDFLAPFIERDRKAWRIQDSANRFELEYLPAGIRLRCCGTNPRTLHGLAPALSILDEAAQWQVNESERLWNAILTASGKQGASRILAISTAPTRRDHWMSRLLREGGPGIWTRLYQAKDDALTWANVKRANPGLSSAPTLAAAIRAELEHARRDEASAHGFRAYRLNLGTSEQGRQFLIDANTWAALPLGSEREGEPIWGVDMGGGQSWSACAAYWPDTGLLDCMAVVGSDPTLDARERADRVESGLYLTMRRRGELAIIEGKRVPDPLDLLRLALERYGEPQAIVADRYRLQELADAVDALGLRPAPVKRGMGGGGGGGGLRPIFSGSSSRSVSRPAGGRSSPTASSERRVPTLFRRMGICPARSATGPPNYAQFRLKATVSSLAARTDGQACRFRRVFRSTATSRGGRKKRSATSANAMINAVSKPTCMVGTKGDKTRIRKPPTSASEVVSSAGPAVWNA